jgi:hypothetical protein
VMLVLTGSLTVWGVQQAAYHVLSAVAPQRVGRPPRSASTPRSP